MLEKTKALSHKSVPGQVWVKRFLKTFYLALVILLILDFFIHKHAEFPWEGFPEFFALYGFVSCILLVFIVKLIGPLLRRDEHYYD